MRSAVRFVLLFASALRMHKLPYSRSPDGLSRARREINCKRPPLFGNSRKRCSARHGAAALRKGIDEAFLNE